MLETFVLGLKVAAVCFVGFLGWLTGVFFIAALMAVLFYWKEIFGRKKSVSKPRSS